MVDNVVVSANVGTGATVATDDIGGVMHQRIKIVLGVDGVSDGDVSSTNPMPVNVPKEVFSQSVPVINSTHYFVHKGEVFRYWDSVTLNSGVSQDYLITTPNATPWAHMLIHADGIAVTSFLLFEAADRIGATAQTIINANRNSANTSIISIHKGTSGGTTDGTQLTPYSSGSAGGNSRTPSDLNYASEWILKQNTKYIIRITSGTAGNLCNLALEWYEHVYGT